MPQGYSIVRGSKDTSFDVWPLASGFWGLPDDHKQEGTSTFAVSVDTLYYGAFTVRGEVTISDLGLFVSTAASAGKVARMGIYAADQGWQPGALQVDAGEVAIDSTGNKSVTGLSTVLPAGHYLTAVHCDEGFTARAIKRGVTPGTADAFNGQVAQLRVAKAYAALADPGTDWDTTSQADVPGMYQIVLAKWS